MSFWPLPKTLCDLLRSAAAHGPVLEPGAGGGELATRLDRLTPGVIRIDRSPRQLGCIPAAMPRVAGDLLALPVRSRVAGGVVLGNLVRHLSPAQRVQAAAETARVLAPGGVCVVLEDDPTERNSAESNYRRALLLLAQADPLRGGALAASTLRPSFAELLGDPIAVGKGDNAEQVRDPLAPVRWLEIRPRLPFQRATLTELRRAIEQQGMEYGRFWFQVYRPEAR